MQFVKFFLIIYKALIVPPVPELAGQQSRKGMAVYGKGYVKAQTPDHSRGMPVGKTRLVETILVRQFDCFVKIDLEKRRDLHTFFEGNLDPE